MPKQYAVINRSKKEFYIYNTNEEVCKIAPNWMKNHNFHRHFEIIEKNPTEYDEFINKYCIIFINS